MDRELDQLRRLAPEEVSRMELRYEILSAIASRGPIGRRALAAGLDKPERTVRTEADCLRVLGLVQPAAGGMRVTADGEELLGLLSPMLRALAGVDRLGQRLEQYLGVDLVYVQTGNVEQETMALRELCRQTGSHVLNVLQGQSTLAVMGGSTMATLALMLPRAQLPGVVVVPARGGLGENMDMQANTVAAQCAQRLGAQYRMLHLPDDIEPAALERMADHTAQVREVLRRVQQPDVLLYGIGRADAMTERRGLPERQAKVLMKNGAVAEALGCYFDLEGRMVYAASHLGVDVRGLNGVRTTIAVAGGKSKSEAILAVVRGTHPTALFIDEAAAMAMLEALGAGQENSGQ